MSAPNWQRVQQLYHAALERAPEERAAFLREACEDADDLRCEVESLLAHEGPEPEILNRPAWAGHSELLDVSSPHISPTLVPGDSLGPYRVMELLGIGGMGEVYRARDVKLGRDVAIKVLPEAFSRDPERMARFRREAQLLASLNHPNIAAIFGLVESDAVHALVLELVEGPTLAARIAQRHIPLDETLAIARQIAEALEYAHDKGIVHRDLKPANVKVNPEGIVKVLDFGLAKATNERVATIGSDNSTTLATTVTEAGVILGTCAYMSPEQARGKPVNRLADIWAFGAVMYETLAGRPPFGGETVSDTLAQVIANEPDWRALPRDTPARIRKLLERCLRKDPRQRLQAIGEARITIGEQAEEAVGASVRRSHTWAPWLVAGMLAISLAITIVLLSRAVPALRRPLLSLNVEIGPGATLSGVTGVLALSPDGTRAAFVIRDADGKQRLAVRPLDQDRLTSLAGTEEAISPFFSPDGDSIAFFAQGKLKKVSVQGGVPVTLCEAADQRGASWGDDGNIVLALSSSGGLWRIPSGGGTLSAVTQLQPGEATQRWPQVLPGSTAVLFVSSATHGNFDGASIEVVLLKTGQRKTVFRGGANPRYLASGHLVFMRQAELVAAPFDLRQLRLTGDPVPILQDVPAGGPGFDVSTGGIFVYHSVPTQSEALLSWLDGSGNTRPLHPTPGRYDSPRFSPDGRRLAFSRGNGRGSDIWVRDLIRDSDSRMSRLQGQNRSMVWTPDGKQIFFSSSNPAAPGIYWIRADREGEAHRVTDGKLGEWPVSFSPNGNYLAITGEGENVEALIAKVEGKPEQLRLGQLDRVLQATFITAGPMFSPDGNWLAYTSNEAGPLDVYVRSFPDSGRKWRISNGGGWKPLWSRNGRELFFESMDGHITVSDYVVKGDAFIPGRPRVWSEKPLFNVGVLYNYDVAPDGKRFAIITAPPDTPVQKPLNRVTFLLNFFDELKRRVPAHTK